MSNALPFDLRPLAGFYPDRALRHRAHYEFAHGFLPQLVHSRPEDFFGPCAADHHQLEHVVRGRFAVFEALTGRTAPWPGSRPTHLRMVSDLTAVRTQIDGRFAVLITMPTPEECPEAIFILAIKLSADDLAGDLYPASSARVFTLERITQDDEASATLPTRGVICEWDPTPAHRNYGRVIEPRSEAFIGAVTEIVRGRTPQMMGYVPPQPEQALEAHIAFNTPDGIRKLTPPGVPYPKSRPPQQ